MNPFQTPLKKKVNEFRQQIRNQQMNELKSQLREINQLTTIKKANNDKFKKLIHCLTLDCLNFGILEEMKRMHKQDGFVTKQSDAQELTTVLLKLLKMTESQTKEEQKTNGKGKIERGNYIKSQEKQAAVKMLAGLLGLLAWNAKQFPQISAYDDEKILQTVLEIIKVSTITEIKSECLRLTFYINQNIDTKKYFLSHGLLTILTNQKYLDHCKLIENLLTDGFRIAYFKAQKQNVDQLLALFDVLKQKIYTQIDNDTVLQIHNFIECFTQQLSPQIKSYDKLIKLMFFMLKKCQNIDCNEHANEEWYTKIIENIINAIENWKGISNEDEKQCLLPHLQKFWLLNQRKIKQYEKVVKEINISRQDPQLVVEANIKELGLQKGKIQVTIDRLMTLFLFIYERMPEEQRVKIYTEQLFYHFYEEFKKDNDGELSIFQFRMLIKYYKGFDDNDLPNITHWCYRFMDDKICRNECLKKLSLALKKQKIPYSEFSSLRNSYNQRKAQLSGEISDELTSFIFNFQEYESLADIEVKQAEVRRRQDEWERKQYDEHFQEVERKKMEMIKSEESMDEKV